MFPHPPKSDSNNLPELFLTFNNYGTLPETRGRSDGQMDRLTDMRAYRAAIAAKKRSYFTPPYMYNPLYCLSPSLSQVANHTVLLGEMAKGRPASM